MSNNAIVKAPTAEMVPVSIEALGGVQHKDSAKPEANRSVDVPYIGFRGKKSEKNVDALDAAGIKVNSDGDGMFYLVANGEPINVVKQGRLFPLHILKYARFFTQYPKEGTDQEKMTPSFVSYESDDEAFKSGVREEIFAVTAVPTGDGHYMAALLRVKSAQVAAIRPALKLLEAAENVEEWSRRGEKHKESAAAKHAGGRVLLEMWSTREKPKTGKGEPYNEGHGKARPTTAAEAAAFNAWLTESFPRIQVAYAKFNMQVEALRRLAVGEEPIDSGDTPPADDPIPF